MFFVCRFFFRRFAFQLLENLNHYKVVANKWGIKTQRVISISS